jgi:hypothetical protein
MINKEKTIDKAVLKYHSIFPVHGKDSIEECFFNIRGEYYFLFKTKDRTRHIVKAEISRPKPITSSASINRDFFISIYNVLNKPILVRSLFIKNSDSSPPVYVNRDLFISIYNTLNKPIFVRSPVIKNSDSSSTGGSPVYANRDLLASIYKALNKPIYVRSLFVRTANTTSEQEQTKELVDLPA